MWCVLNIIIVFVLLFVLLLGEGMIPAGRCGHATVTYGNTIILFGGADRL